MGALTVNASESGAVVDVLFNIGLGFTALSVRIFFLGTDVLVFSMIDDLLMMTEMIIEY